LRALPSSFASVHHIDVAASATSLFFLADEEVEVCLPCPRQALKVPKVPLFLAARVLRLVSAGAVDALLICLLLVRAAGGVLSRAAGTAALGRAAPAADEDAAADTGSAGGAVVLSTAFFTGPAADEDAAAAVGRAGVAVVGATGSSDPCDCPSALL